MTATGTLDLVSHPFLQAEGVEFVVAGCQNDFILCYLLLQFRFNLGLGRQTGKLGATHSTGGVLVLDHEELKFGFETLAEQELR